MERKMRPRLTTAISAAIILFYPVMVMADMITVPGDASTIQEAIDLAADYDTVSVAAGKYYENITILDKSLAIIGADGPLNTFLYPLDSNSAVVSVYKWTPDSLFAGEFSGFTVSGGGYSPTIYIDLYSRIVIRNNIFSANIPIEFYDFGVIVCGGDSSAPVITRNIFYNNFGAACVYVEAGAPQVINNTFDGNRSAVVSLTDRTTVLNNVVINAVGTAFDGVYAGLDYNDLWNNATDYG